MAEKKKNIKRWEIWYANLGNHPKTSVQSGERPVLIISNDLSNTYAKTVTVLPMTSQMKKIDLPSHTLIRKTDCIGLKKDSLTLAEQITTIDKTNLENCIGRVRAKEVKRKIAATVKSQLEI